VGQVEPEIIQIGLAEAVECAGSGIVITDTEGKIQYVNPAFLNMTGYSREEVVGQSTNLLKSGQHPKAFYDNLWSTIREGKSWRGEMVNRRKDGSFYSEEMQIDPIRDEAKAIKGYIATKLDVTKRLAAESAQALLAAVVEASEDAICSLTLDGTVVSWNQGAEALLGYSSNELIGRSIVLLALPDRSHKLEEYLGLVRAGGRISNSETVLCGKGNVEVAVSFSIFPIRDAHGAIAGASVIAHEIGSRIQAENKLRESGEMFRKVFAQAPNGMCVIGMDGKYLIVNPNFCSMVGYSEKELLSMSWEDLTLPQDIPSSRKSLQRLLDSPAEVASLNKRYQHRDGSKIWVRLKYSLLSDSAGRPIHCVFHVEDITERVRLEQEKWELQVEAQATIDALSSSICVLDDTGAIISVNESWKSYSAENRRDDGSTWAPVSFKVGLGEGENYLQACERAAGLGALEAVEFAEGIREVMTGICDHYAQEYSCDEPFNSRSFLASVTRFYVNQRPRIVVEHINITDRKLAEDAILEAKLIAEAETRKLDFQYSLIRAIDRVSLDGILVVDAGRKVVSYNDRFLELWKLPVPETVDPLQRNTTMGSSGDLILIALLENVKDAAAFADRVQELYDAPEEKDHCEIELTDGRTLERYSSSLRGEDQQYLGRVWCFRDISERKSTESELADSERRFRRFFEDNRSVMAVIDPEDGKILDANQAALDFFGYSSEQFVGMYSGDISVLDPAEGKAVRTRALAERQLCVPGRMRLASAELRDIETYFTPLNVGGRPLLFAVMHDVTERLQAESQLRESEETFRLLTKNIRELFWVKDGEGKKMQYLSPAFQDIWGLPCESIYKDIGSLMDVIHPDHRQTAVQIFARQLQGEDTETEFRVNAKDGKEKWIRDRAFPICDADGRVLRVVGVAEDITERKLANDALRESEERYRATFEQAAIGIVHTSPGGRFLRCNARFAEIIGYKPEEVVGLSYLQVTAPEDEAECAKMLWELINGKKKIPSFEMRYVCKDGSITWVKSTISFLRDSGGDPLYYVTLVEDINARKLAESLLRETSERLMLATRAGGVGIWDRDLLGDRLVWDEQMFRLFGFESGRSLDARQTWVEGLHPDDALQINEGMAAAARGEAEFDTEFRVVWPDGSIHNIRAIAFVQRDDSGQALHLIGTNWDITPQKRSAEALLQSNRMLQEETARASALAEEAAAATLAKSDFLANMSHEIRTPMNGVIGMTGLLLDTDLSSEQRRFAETVRASGESLLHLINDILDFSKIEAQKLELETVDFDLPRLLGSIAGSIAAQAYAKNIELIASADPEVPTWVCGDPGRVRQVVTNLLGNALKFTSKGEVVLRVVATEKTETQWLLRFSVRDTGIGIPADKLSGIFEKFTQVDSSTTRQFGGTGLGLAISQHLAQLMGGDIGVNSEDGKGSEFWFTVRLGPSAKTEEQSPAESMDALRGLQVLIVDDLASSREVLSRQLIHWGMRTEEAESGIAALQAIYKAKDLGKSFHLVLIDMQMPGMDGEAVGRAVKSDERLHDTRIVMLTSLGARHGEQRCRQIGFAHTASKPVQREELRSVLLAACGVVPPPGSDSAVLRGASILSDSKQTQSIGMGNARILIAEDNFTNQQVALGILKKLGLRADAVADGAEALKSLQTIPYDLVLMDMRMPVMDGVEAARRIRDPQSLVLNRDVPIIAMTANVQQSDRDRCLSAGMNDFVPKPVMPDMLQQALQKWLPSQHLRTSSDGVKSESIPAADKGAIIFDGPGILKRMMGDEDLVKLILKSFLDDIPGQILKLKESLQAGDVSASARQAHSIRGAAANVGGERLRHTAKKMEIAADAGDLDGARACLQALEFRFLELKDEIKQQDGVY